MGMEVGLFGSEVVNCLRMVVGEMESWKNWESLKVSRAEASCLEKRDSACLDTFEPRLVGIWMDGICTADMAMSMMIDE